MPVEDSQQSTHDYSASVIRTFTAIAVGFLLGWLGSDVVGVNEATLTPLVSAAFAAVYHAAVRAIEHKWPKAGYLLGWPVPPTYTKSEG